MSSTVRWSLVFAGAVVVFALCVWAGDAVLPWDRAERIAVGAGAGAVIAGLLGAWAGSATRPSPPPPPGPGAGPVASGERSVAVGENSGVIVTGDGGTVGR
ncbi:hypothetical protein [Streptomyces marincola]|uniref:hypothetical protein n=1 Tax=Streptomyces marincola TaxID=2878388 RepID=UPI001CF4F766|nr:hypothetical protein [Streptomyces marincola]UCM89213.1 hypothetical protein LC193_15365 [Streptomyces marincola]